MSSPRAELVIRGEVVVAAQPSGLETAEAIGIGGGRVVAAGSFADVSNAASRDARVVDARGSAVVPGLHDFHVHLVGLARTLDGILLEDARDGREVAHRLRAAALNRPADAWVTGRGWSEAQLAGIDPAELDAAAEGRPAFLSSRDLHSAWASPAARALAGLSTATDDPPAGRLERDASGNPTGVLRETARELVAALVSRPQGGALRPLLDATLSSLAAHGITGASEAGDYTDRNGIGTDAGLGDSFSSLTDLGELVDGRVRLSIGIPADTLAVAAERGLRTGAPLGGRRTMRMGWAKEYADGALGSGTAALFEPSSCGTRDTGILRVTPERLDGIIAAGRTAGIAPAIHAIGDRAVATVLDAVERAPAARPGTPPDRMEHVQLLRFADAGRLARLGLTASIQPIHAAADRDLVDDCWAGGDRPDRAYAWRTLLAAGVRLAAGSDTPVESVDPWLGIFAAVHRRPPTDTRGDWRPGEALTVAEALAAYTLGPARALGVADEGHLRPGARADVAVLSVGLDVLLAADERLAGVRSTLTLVDGREVHGT